jgi:hypothetical protein
MATINPTGMGYKTSRQFHRFVNDIKKYANSIYEYGESNPAGGQWYNSHVTMRTGVVKHSIQSPVFYPTHASTPLSSTFGRRDRRKTSQ